ncbi:MAG TPA: DUF2207 domain-containing protein, partial [Acidimicrobiia bacterium]|nr:DUF2207 domain-containing protein [Acidimicrobiia bacterium]
MRYGLRFALATGAFLAAFAAPGHAAGPTPTYVGFEAVYEIAPDSTIRVTERINVDFVGQRHGIFRDLDVKVPIEGDPDHYRVYSVAGVSVTRNGVDEPFEKIVSGTQDERVQYKIGDADTFISGPQEYVIRYRLTGALDSYPDHAEFYWDVTGHGWESSFETVTAVVIPPAEISRVACFAEAEGTRPHVGCLTAQNNGNDARFADDFLGSYEEMTIVVGFPSGSIDVPPPVLEEKWTPAQAFEPTPANVGVGVAVGGGLFALLFRALRRGRDQRAVTLRDPGDGSTVSGIALDAGDAPVQFRPPEGLRPAHLGLLDDEVVHPVDIGATVVDLAIRGHLRIEDRRGPDDDDPEWVLVLGGGGAPDDELLDYEQRLLVGLEGQAQDNEVVLSELRGEFASDFAEVKEQIYDDAMRRQWFRTRPDTVRAGMIVLGVVAIAVGIGTIVATQVLQWKLALVAIPWILFGLANLVMHKRFPSKTPAGTEALVLTRGFKKFIETAEKPEMNYAVERNEFVKYLPYAVAFGSVEAWSRATRGLDVAAATSGWYAGPGFHSWGAFGSGFGSFSSNVGSDMSYSPSSSGGGSGFSGGGG